MFKKHNFNTSSYLSRHHVECVISYFEALMEANSNPLGLTVNMKRVSLKILAVARIFFPIVARIDLAPNEEFQTN